MYFGLREVNGILYYFGSRMYQDESVTVDGKNYYCKSSGEAVELSKNGWNLVDGKLSVCKRWSAFERMPRENRGCLYYFGYSGVMLSDTNFRTFRIQKEDIEYMRMEVCIFLSGIR